MKKNDVNVCKSFVRIFIESFHTEVNTFRQSRYQRNLVYCYLTIGTKSPFLIDYDYDLMYRTVCIFQAEAIAYPEPGVAYDPSKFDTWSQHRGFQNPLEVGSGFITF
jgi:hypothetical protein